MAGWKHEAAGTLLPYTAKKRNIYSFNDLELEVLDRLQFTDTPFLQ